MSAGIVSVVIYIIIMLCIGWWAMRKTKGVGDFFLGGRTIGPWLSAFAYGTTYFSAVLFVGYGGRLGWGFGLNTMWIVVGNALVGCMLAWMVLGRRTLREQERESSLACCWRSVFHGFLVSRG